METINGNNQNGLPITVGDSYGKGWDVLWKTFVELLVVTIIYGIISMPTAVMRFESNTFQWYFVPIIFFAIIYGIFIASPINFSVRWVFLKAVRREKIEVKDMFSVFERNYWNAVIAGLVVGVIVAIGFIMLIVPGIIFACRLAFVKYLVIDQKMEAMEALRTSWEMTRGQGWTIFLMGLLAIPLAIAGLIMLFFGVIIAGMWISAAFAVIYHLVCLKRGEFIMAIDANNVSVEK